MAGVPWGWGPMCHDSNVQVQKSWLICSKSESTGLALSYYKRNLRFKKFPSCTAPLPGPFRYPLGCNLLRHWRVERHGDITLRKLDDRNGWIYISLSKRAQVNLNVREWAYWNKHKESIICSELGGSKVRRTPGGARPVSVAEI